MLRPRSLLVVPALGLALVAARPAGAEDLDKLLNSIPDAEIEQTAPPAEAAEAPPEEVTLPGYLTKVQADIWASWTPKAKLIKKNPKAKTSFMVKIGREGELLGVSPVSLSGIKAFDQSALDAIAAAEPYPVPPRELDGDAERGLVIDFKARQYAKR